MAGTERRARFSYDDLLELFSFREFYEELRIVTRLTDVIRRPKRQLPALLQLMRALVVPTAMVLVKVAFLIT